MKCPNLVTIKPICCSAFKKPYFPSLFQLKEYCLTNEYIKCPFNKGNKGTLQQSVGVDKSNDC